MPVNEKERVDVVIAIMQIAQDNEMIPLFLYEI